MEIEEIRNQFNNTEKLYHYTTFENAIKILQSHSMLFGRLKDMNDINELYRPLAFDFHPSHFGDFSEETYIKMVQDFYKYQQISLTLDGKRNGFDIPAMWGHYANKGKGVCLVFNKNKLISLIKADEDRHIVHDKVKYTKDYSPVIVYRTDENNTIISFNKREEKDYFFHKTKDWMYEQEYRILIKTDSEYREKFDFQDSLVAIVMHNAASVSNDQSVFTSLEYEILNKIKGPFIPILEHSMWFNDTQLTIKEHTIWTSDSVNEDNLAIDV